MLSDVFVLETQFNKDRNNSPLILSPNAFFLHSAVHHPNEFLNQLMQTYLVSVLYKQRCSWAVRFVFFYKYGHQM
jgi:hypothetical protein